MRQSKTLKILSYIFLPILVGIIILSAFYIGVKDSNYFNEEKYFNSENFVSSYMSKLSYVVGRLIYNNPSYKNIKDGEMQIFYTTSGEFDYKDPEMYFLVIYNKKALTNVELTSEINTIEGIKNYIENNENSKKFNIVKGEIQAETEILKKKSEQYLENFTNTYYTRGNVTEAKLEDTEYAIESNTETAKSTIEYVTANIEDYEIYTSYYEKFSENSEQVMANYFIENLEPYESNLYAAIPACSMLVILILVYLIVSIGHEKDKDGISTNDFDRIPLEIIIAIVICVGCIPFAILSEISLSNVELAESLTITAFITVYILMAITFDTVVKRLKSRTFWDTTLLGKFINIIMIPIHKLKDLDAKARSTSKYFSSISRKILLCAISPIAVVIISLIVFGENLFFTIIAEGITILIVVYQITSIVVNIDKIEKKLKEMYEGNNQNTLNIKEFMPEFHNTITYINDISNGFENSIQERIKSERLKAELITNVSHDIKTPLTSIINYVDLLKQEDIQNEKANEYIGILDNKSQRLKKLIADLVEASKISTGNVTLNLEKINIVELIKQAVGEFEDKFEEKGLEILIDCKVNEINIMADSRYMYRIIENLFSNISKYALENSRVYIDIIKVQDEVYIEIKNISKDKLNISAEELMQRFVRGDKSRTTEGSGLGISIAQNLAELQNGEFNLKLDGDLFKVELVFDVI